MSQGAQERAALQPKEVLCEGDYLRMVRQGTWEYVERKGSTGVVGLVPLTDQNEIVLVEQFRVPCGKRVVELPAGLVGDHAGEAQESFETAAIRELEEETGYKASRLTFLMSGPNSSGSSSSRMSIYLAEGLTKVGPGGGDEQEDITVHVVPLTRIAAWLDERRNAGFLLDPKIYAGLWFTEHRP